MLILAGPLAGGFIDGSGDAEAIVFVAAALFIDGGLARGTLRRTRLRRWDWNWFRGVDSEDVIRAGSRER